MSIHVSSACKKLDYTGSTRAVLLEFADFANDDGVCWPGNARIMYNTGLSKSAVKDAIRHLKRDGILTVEDHAKGGRGKIPVYRVHPEKGSEKKPFDEWKVEVFGPDEDEERGQILSEDEGERGQNLDKRGQNLEHEPSGNRHNEPSDYDDDSLRSSSSSGEPEATSPEPPAAIPLEKYLTSRIYDELKERLGVRLDGKQFAFHLGRVRNVIDNDEMTAAEEEALPGVFAEIWPKYPKVDALKALQEIRRRKALERPKPEEPEKRRQGYEWMFEGNESSGEGENTGGEEVDEQVYTSIKPFIARILSAQGEQEARDRLAEYRQQEWFSDEVASRIERELLL